MYILEPVVHHTIWGGSKIASRLNLPYTDIGHLYIAYDREDMSNVILNGQYKGKTLHEIFPLMKNEWKMEEYTRFPLTLAITEADKDLSIQVHPTDKKASELANLPLGKRESWYFLDAPGRGSIVNGCIPKDIDSMKNLVDQNSFTDIIDYLPVKEGEYVFVEPGTLHAITSGSMVYEIEEGADITYRFYDYDRTDDKGNKRELHVQQALQCVMPTYKSVAKEYSGKIIEKTYFTEKLENVSSYMNSSDQYVTFTLLEGSGKLEGIDMHFGSTVILEPGEEITGLNIKLAMVAGLNR